MGKGNAKLLKELKSFKNSTKDKYGIEKLILFGSQVSGKQRKWSDVDLIVVSKKVKNNRLGFIMNMYDEWHIKQNINHPVDFICFTPKEFNERRNGPTIVMEAVKEGIII